MDNIHYGKHHIIQADIDAVTEVLHSELLTQGPVVAKFEEEFARYVGSNYAVAMANGTAALHLACMALGVNASSNVITTPMTFAASSNCVLYCGGKVTFADIDPETGLISIESVRLLLKNSPKGTYQGVIPVDYAGYAVNTEELRALADEYGMWILEDACHAPGGYFTDSKDIKQRCGNGRYADLTAFSFHPVKHITCGEGGMITTNNAALHKKIADLRTHGIIRNEKDQQAHGGWYYDMPELGYNYRMTDIGAALGLSHLRRANEMMDRRHALAAAYDKVFKGCKDLEMITPPKDGGHAYHLYVVKLKNRRQVYDELKKYGIITQVHYVPTHMLSYYQSMGYKTGSLPNAEAFYAQCLSLPLYPGLTDEEQARVIESVFKVLG